MQLQLRYTVLNWEKDGPKYSVIFYWGSLSLLVINYSLLIRIQREFLFMAFMQETRGKDIAHCVACFKHTLFHYRRILLFHFNVVIGNDEWALIITTYTLSVSTP